MTTGDWCPRCGFPRCMCYSDEAAYVAELQKARDELIKERDKLKAELEETKRQRNMAMDLHKITWGIIVFERDEARRWARKFYKQIMESEDDIFFIARMLRNYEAYKQYITKLRG